MFQALLPKIVSLGVGLAFSGSILGLVTFLFASAGFSAGDYSSALLARHAGLAVALCLALLPFALLIAELTGAERDAG